VKVGDLLLDTADGDLGIVTSEVCSYGTIDGPAGQYCWVKWNSLPKTQRLTMTAVKRGWVKVVSASESR
jgi:hypothetical protein